MTPSQRLARDNEPMDDIDGDRLEAALAELEALDPADSPDSAARLQVLVDTDDGFEIARADLRLRGMGDLFGERQSGLPMFRVADPMRDEALNVKAREAADLVMQKDPELKAPTHRALRKVLGQRYARALELFRVG